MLETLGYARTDSRWSRATAVSESTAATKTNCCGASTIAAGWKTAKKFGSKRPHSTSRVLVRRVCTLTPCTSQVTVSPSCSRRSVAISVSIENSKIESVADARPNQAPVRIFSVATVVSR